MSVESRIGKIDHRSWRAMRGFWLETIPEIQPPGSKPATALSELPSLVTTWATIPDVAEIQDMPGLRQLALWEAVFLLHKAAHVLRAAEAHAAGGMRSWCLFSAYHSAFLAAKSAIGFLGVSIVQPLGRSALIDVFPLPRAARKKWPRQLGSSDRPESFTVLRVNSFEQRYLWLLLQRVLRVTEADCWSVDIKESLINLDWKDISPRRNKFIYRASFWPFSDLHQYNLDPDFGRLQKSDGSIAAIDANDDIFLLKLSFFAFYVAYCLLRDLAEDAPILARELEVLLIPTWSQDTPKFSHTFAIDPQSKIISLAP